MVTEKYLEKTQKLKKNFLSSLSYSSSPTSFTRKTADRNGSQREQYFRHLGNMYTGSKQLKTATSGLNGASGVTAFFPGTGIKFFQEPLRA